MAHAASASILECIRKFSWCDIKNICLFSSKRLLSSMSTFRCALQADWSLQLSQFLSERWQLLFSCRNWSSQQLWNFNKEIRMLSIFAWVKRFGCNECADSAYTRSERRWECAHAAYPAWQHKTERLFRNRRSSPWYIRILAHHRVGELIALQYDNFCICADIAIYHIINQGCMAWSTWVHLYVQQMSRLLRTRTFLKLATENSNVEELQKSTEINGNLASAEQMHKAFMLNSNV